MAPQCAVFQVPPLMCNCSIIWDDETKDCVVVDPGGNVDKLKAKIDGEKLRCKRILITHGHLDHILGATSLKKALQADGHTDVAICMNQEDKGLYEKVDDQCRDFRVRPPSEALDLPDAWLAHGDVVDIVSGVTVQCLHCPGHTPGSMTYHFKEHKLCCPGDTLFAGSIGRTTWDNIPSLRGTSNHEELVRSIKTNLLSLDPETEVICGHGETSTIGDEQKFNPHLR